MKLKILRLAAIAFCFASAARAQGALPFKKTSDDAPVRNYLIAHSALKDPFSVQFRNVYSREIRSEAGSPSKFIYCGELNSKNSFGAYGGWSRFFAGNIGDSAFVEVDESGTGVASGGFIKLLCKDVPATTP